MTEARATAPRQPDGNTISLKEPNGTRPTSWWLGASPEQFYAEAKKRHALIAESTFGTWSNKSPTSVATHVGDVLGAVAAARAGAR